MPIGTISVIGLGAFGLFVLCGLAPTCIPKYRSVDTSFDPDIILDHKYSERYLRNPAIVKTQNGLLEGFFMQVVGGRVVYAFQGVPFAEPPVGYWRFRPPRPKKPWPGLLKAKTSGPPCLQINSVRLLQITGSEDCLFVDIYTPKLPTLHYHPKFPVILFIPGGGFLFGGANDYGPAYLLTRDVILVTINYRVGILGFIGTNDEYAPGNAGLKDQSEAIKWVHQHIDAFGGDPSKITIMGNEGIYGSQSAGGASVHLQLLSKRSIPYFTSAIAMSGTALSPFAMRSGPFTRNLTKMVAEFSGCPNYNSEVMVECLRSVPGSSLVTNGYRLLQDVLTPLNTFLPTIEPIENNPDPFLTEDPISAYAEGRVGRKPLMGTSVRYEAVLFIVAVVIPNGDIIRNNFNSTIPSLLYYKGKVNNENETTDKLMKFYFGDRDILQIPLREIQEVATDRYYLAPLHQMMQLHSQVAPSYAYLFDYRSKYNTVNARFGFTTEEIGATHADDLLYLFNGSYLFDGLERKDHEMHLSRFMCNMIVNFAAKGKPVYTDENDNDVHVWDPIMDPLNMSYLYIDNKGIKMVPEPFSENSLFWANLGLRELTPLRLNTYDNEMYESGHSWFNL